MKRNILVLIGILAAFTITAQTRQPMISWEKTVHNFGAFNESAGIQTTEFQFTNTGNEPLFITNVQVSCGCTLVEYTKEPVTAGNKGYVKVSYNPQNRPGKFNKTTTVTSNTENPTTILRIEGEVTARQKGIEDYFTREFGPVRLRSSHAAFAKVFNNQTSTDTISIVNMSNEPQTISFEQVPQHISISVSPQTLKGKQGDEKHGEIGLITIKYDATKKNDWGYTMDGINTIINGDNKNPNQYRITISANIEENFSHLTKDELANAPKIEFDKTEFNFGKVKSGEKADNNFTFKNTGKSDLIIRKVKASCGCTASNPEKMVIKSGESSFISTSFNTAGRKGPQTKTITIITNDPSQSNITLKIVGEIEETNTSN